jgi:hypothetical protein
MKPLNAILGAALAAAALAAPADASVAGTGLTYTVTASSDSIQAACVFRPDRVTLDYPPTQVDGYVVSTITPSHVSIRCTAYNSGSSAGEVWGSGTNVATVSDTIGFLGTRNIRVCIDAYAASTVIDAGDQAHNCTTY